MVCIRVDFLTIFVLVETTLLVFAPVQNVDLNFHKAWQKSKGATCGPAEWLQRNRRMWELLLPVTAVDEILTDTATEIDWDTHTERIQEIVQSAWLGKALFGFALPQIIRKKIHETLRVAVAALAALETIDEEKYLQARVDAKAKVKAIEDLSTLPERREIVVDYRGWPLKTWVKSIEEECELTFACHLRAWATQLSLLPSLPGETELCVEESQNLTVKSIAEILLHDAQASRDHLLKVLKTQNLTDGDKIEVQSQEWDLILHPEFYLNPFRVHVN
eukprot:312256-Amphidinium_carterae.2